MIAMRLTRAGQPLAVTETSIPVAGQGQIVVKTLACGVCRTDLHVVDGELPNIRYPLTPGHEVVGRVVSRGPDVQRFAVGDRVGIPWLGRTCGKCRYCLEGRENLCELAQFTGYTIDGGYAEYVCADERFCLAIPAPYSDAEAAPLLCAGLIGYRAYQLAGDAPNIGLYGFGASAHILAQIATQQGRAVYAFTRPGDAASQSFARQLGATWAGSSGEHPEVELDAAIIFAPAGELVPQALGTVRKGGRVVCAGIHMTDIPSFPYRLLWGERSVASVANLTRTDGEEFMNIAAGLELHPAVEVFDLRKANEALVRLRSGALRGAAVLMNGA
jgi:propanol-preferring alcohol dehydrogenase